jgi:hypothetical protein
MTPEMLAYLNQAERTLRLTSDFFITSLSGSEASGAFRDAKSIARATRY